jgi:starch synthase
MCPAPAMTITGASGYPRVLFVSSEIFPLAKTGGLGDVSAALPAALARLGADMRLMLPGYPRALDLTQGKRLVARLKTLPSGGRLIEGRMPDSGLPVYLYDAPDLYRRDGTLYQDQHGRDWPDNHLRYAAFCHAAASVALGTADAQWRPEIVHANDWHSGLLPAILKARGPVDLATLFTIHNMAFQGNFPPNISSDLGLPAQMLSPEGIEFFGQVSFLKAGIRYSDRITTVSPTYAKEILTPEYGCGMEGLLKTRADDLVGILNGVDYSIWDPAVDTAIACRYTAENLRGKEHCKAALRQELGLDASNAPLIAFVNRLTQQKMADVVLEALPALIHDGAQFILHGQGDKSLEAAFLTAAQGRSSQVAVRIGYDESLAHRFIAASDISLTPSRFEPCGLTTMYAMRYGALPVTRRVGGLADTVVDAESEEAQDGSANGFLFDDETPEAMVACVRRAGRWFHGRDWRRIQRSAMRHDFGWERSAKRYLSLYRDLVAALPLEARAARESSLVRLAA